MCRLLVPLCALIGLTLAVQPFGDDGYAGEMAKRKSAYMRFGRSDPDMVPVEDEALDMEKRKSAYMRFGKRSAAAEQELVPEDEMALEKRKSAYMRFGKRKSAYMRFGKRSPVESMIEEAEPLDMEKRKSAYMRFGK
ncbi:unnamed protein product, partial [Mesorhabditis spiculigera]